MEGRLTGFSLNRDGSQNVTVTVAGDFAETYDKLKDTMEIADLVKFAKYSASTLESDTALNSMTDFVNESHAQYMQRKAEEEARLAEMKKLKQEEPTGKEDVKDV